MTGRATATEPATLSFSLLAVDANGATVCALTVIRVMVMVIVIVIVMVVSFATTESSQRCIQNGYVESHGPCFPDPRTSLDS